MRARRCGREAFESAGKQRYAEQSTVLFRLIPADPRSSTRRHDENGDVGGGSHPQTFSTVSLAASIWPRKAFAAVRKLASIEA